MQIFLRKNQDAPSRRVSPGVTRKRSRIKIHELGGGGGSNRDIALTTEDSTLPAQEETQIRELGLAITALWTDTGLKAALARKTGKERKQLRLQLGEHLSEVKAVLAGTGQGVPALDQ